MSERAHVAAGDAAPVAVVFDAQRAGWLRLSRPREILVAQHLAEVRPALQRLEQLVETQGWYAAGWVSYEAAPAFDPALAVRPDVDGPPLLWFGLFEPPAGAEALEPAPADRPDPVWEGVPTMPEETYRQRVARIREYLRDGDSYQVNFTYRLTGPAPADPWRCFRRLVQSQATELGAYLDTGRWVVASASPELFFRCEGDRLTSRPMKGTAARGLWAEQDDRQADRLRASPKERAEHLMIVDMVRNDCGRVATAGSVQVPALFDLEAYPTLWQMTSTVTARTAAPLDEIFAALFPPASITGAPKPRTMQLIAELETSPRRLYTGAIGWLAPGRRAQFNVAIRTLLIDRQTAQAQYGVGGGIVWDSEAEAERIESRLKARVLAHRPGPAFELLETFRWTAAEGFFLLEYHLARLCASARYFGFRVEAQAVRRELARLGAGCAPAAQRVRLRVGRTGELHIESAPLDVGAAAVAEVVLAAAPVDRAEPWLYHKTTRRELYQAALAARPGAADVLLYNERDEVTETTIANVAVELDGTWYTPPIDCGLLPGTCRAWLLAQGQLRERPISLAELRASGRVRRLNAVRGLQEMRVRAG